MSIKKPNDPVREYLDLLSRMRADARKEAITIRESLHTLRYNPQGLSEAQMRIVINNALAEAYDSAHRLCRKMVLPNTLKKS
jgi:hypothetical protein